MPANRRWSANELSVLRSTADAVRCGEVSRHRAGLMLAKLLGRSAEAVRSKLRLEVHKHEETAGCR